ncbi:hypothetical protein RhiirC2_789651 [Rhizophagus irregularis]|uniref:Uncharacterized protein n=1 Tax=Rhizophagus irregularis TaxID=588596 RepID=A0A2N1MMP8_9GLOM|nr:hypothetical protein RhiirC2_789651 [Rhizophagus irregularis]
MDLNIEQLKLLCDWPTDSAIRSIFSNSFSLVTELCKTLDDDVPELDIKDLAKQVDLVKTTQSTLSLLIPIITDVQYVLLDGQLNFTQMIEIRAKHEAYNLKVLE